VVELTIGGVGAENDDDKDDGGEDGNDDGDIVDGEALYDFSRNNTQYI